MIIRFRSKDGLFRVNVDTNDTFDKALHGLADQLSKQIINVTVANSPSAPGDAVDEYLGKTIQDLGLKHGDLLFLKYDDQGSSDDSSGAQETNGESRAADHGSKSNGGGAGDGGLFEDPTTTTTTAAEILRSTQQLALDNELDKDPGMIKRPMDPKMCRHGDKGMCDYCMPLEPFNDSYQQEHKIKHLSFHAYLKKLNAVANKTGSLSSYMSPLSEPFYNVLSKCPSGHPQWPAGICSKCQPSAITLQQQTFRMVDHVEFSDSNIANSFIEAWRKSGTQRLGYLYGTYEKYEAVPLGIKAVVQAIYEPPQSDESDGLTLSLPWDEESEKVDRIARLAGLERVGVIFTDLVDSGLGDGSVICKRHVDSYFLSSLEVLFAAKLQAKHPNACKWSGSGGLFSSKFVTCVITGNAEDQIDISSYQVSTSAEAMVKADLIEASVNPSVVRIKEPTSTRYVPEIFYKKTNEYNLTVQENAKPAFPVEYLLVTLTHGFPDTASPMFRAVPGASFSIENRQHLGVSQDLRAVSRALNEAVRHGRLNSSEVSDFHLLVYIQSLGILSEGELELLVKVAIGESKGEDITEDAYVLSQGGGWRTLIEVLKTSS